MTEIKEGKIGIYFLRDIWSYYRGLKDADSTTKEVDWKYINGVFNTLGIGTEPTVGYLLNTSQTFEDFENWILENGNVSQRAIDYFNAVVSGEQNDDTATSDPVFNETDLEHWNKEGYVILRGAISEKDCQKSRDLICDTLDVHLNDASTWYDSHLLKQGIMVQLFQSEILDKNRFSERIRMAFEQLWGKKNLLASMDRVSFNPPETKTYKFPGPNLHWDVSLRQPIPFGLQGILYLTDTSEDQGAFTVIPGFQNSIDDWLNSIDTNPREIDLLETFKEKPIAAKAGDFIIWNHCLPHGSRPNRAASPRIVQYINYQPIDMEYQSEWI